MSRLSVGAPAPDFKLLDQSGKLFSLSESLRSTRSPHLVYFYPKADTPGCTTQACGLRDIAAEVGDTVIVGISPDPPGRQAAFDNKYGLGFPLLADTGHEAAEAFGVWGERSLYGRKFMGIIRSAFLIGADGRVREAWYRITPKDTPKKLLSALAA
ncbi:MAG TPA: peroxiredoxin [Acidimicrobiales bacterium]|nr:peroxiredoxin [Acidimicrobiales bacterium]